MCVTLVTIVFRHFECYTTAIRSCKIIGPVSNGILIIIGNDAYNFPIFLTWYLF